MYPQFEHFLGKALRSAAGSRLSQFARLVKTLLCHGTDAESRRASKGPATRESRPAAAPSRRGVDCVGAPNAKSNGDKLPALGTQGLQQSLDTTKSQQFRNIVLAAGAVLVKSYAPGSTLGALNESAEVRFEAAQK